jgi:biopolymer transport protein ExbD
MAMSASSSQVGGEPMVEMNTTPLIDVMLVLLIMFIITLPPPTHSVPIDLPPSCEPNCPPPPAIQPIKNYLYIAPNSAVSFNQTPVSWTTLQSLLKDSGDPLKFPVTAAQPNGLPELVFGPDPQAPYSTVTKVVLMIKQAKITKMGFAGNENYRSEF